MPVENGVPIIVGGPGTADLKAVAVKLRAAGTAGKGLRNELARGIRAAAKPAVVDVRKSARTTLPARGGLARRAATGITARSRLRPNTVSVKIAARNRFDLQALNRGRLRHPLFGDREWWFQQSVTPGWFTRPLQARQGETRRAVLQVVADIARKLET